jgi:hypothetical protein
VFQSNSQDQTTIARLRLKSVTLDPLATQLRLANALNTMSLHPTGLSPAAILCVRSLRAPKPGSLPGQRGDLRALRAWEEAVTGVIAQLARQAARPIHGPVPANAAAVLFADRAELLACLAMDWGAGEAWSHWWWRGLFRTSDIARAVVAAWLEAIEFVPPALHHLAVQGQAAAFVHRLDDHTARQIWQAMIHTFGLSELHSTLIESRGGDAVKRSDSAALLPPARGKSSPWPGPPWRRWTPDVEMSGLGLEQACWLGLGLMLQRAPGIVRTPGFAQAVADWYQAAKLSDAGRLPDNGLPPLDRATMGARSPAVLPPVEVKRDKAALPPVSPARRKSNVSQNQSEVSKADFQPDLPRPGLLDSEHVQLQTGLPPIDSLVRTAPAAASSFAPDGVEPQVGPDSGQRQSIASAPVSQAKTGFELDGVTCEYEIETEFGGIFFLINLGLFLNLYGDFTTPLAPGIALPIWDFIALVGRELAGEKLQADSAWELLARLAGRADDEAPGAAFQPPDEWRVPTDWLGPFPEQTDWQGWCDQERLRVWHPAGFWVLDIPIGKAVPARVLRRELAAYRATARFELEKVKPASENWSDLTQLERWLHWLGSYLRVRLQRALGVADVPRLLCQQPARIVVTATHFEVYLALANLPIEIRLAGLDRNPGWVPAAGRFVAFHFDP